MRIDRIRITAMIRIAIEKKRKVKCVKQKISRAFCIFLCVFIFGICMLSYVDLILGYIYWPFYFSESLELIVEVTIQQMITVNPKRLRDDEPMLLKKK